MEKIELSLGDQKEVVIREGQAPKIFVYEGFNYRTQNTASFVAAMKRFGSCVDSVMAANNNCIKAIVDCTVNGRPQDTICQEWALSPEALRWGKAINKKLMQADFIKLLEREIRLSPSATLENLLAQLKTLKVNTQIIGDYSMDDRNNYIVMFKTGETEGSSKIPSLLKINIPVIEGGRIEVIDIEIEFILPTNPSEKPVFGLMCPTWDDIVKGSVDFEVSKIAQELPGWLLLKGSL